MSTYRLKNLLSPHSVALVGGSPRPGSVGRAILSVAAESNMGLLVMGGYGHSRLQERILGGVTRSMFASMTVPVLMSH